jgi:hypothetical protein
MTDTVEGADEDGAGEINSAEVPDGGRERSLTFDVEMQDDSDSDSGQWEDTESTSSEEDEVSANQTVGHDSAVPSETRRRSARLSLEGRLARERREQEWEESHQALDERVSK